MLKLSKFQQAEKRYNFIFLPISLFNGMATSKRLSNFYFNLKENNAFTFTNLVHEPDILASETLLTEEKIEGLLYQKIIYNYQKIQSLCKFFYLNYKLLIKNYSNACINILYHSGYPNIRNIFIVLFAKVLGYKIVFDIVEDNSTITSFRSPLHWLKIKSSLLFIRIIHWYANGIVCISDFLYYKLVNITKGSVPIILIPGSFNEDLFLNIKENLDKKSGTTIFYGGSFAEKDGIVYLLSAFDILAEKYNVNLVMSGKGNEKDINIFEAQFQRLKNKNKVQYMGYLEDWEYFKQIQNADILCMVRTNSDFANAGFPFKLAEILATGKPVIATKTSVVEKYLSASDAFIIEPERINEIVNTIKYIIKNPSIANKVGKNGQKVAQKFFSSKNVTKELLDFIIEKIK
jgi:glycosyltransferase involved in cell wall biosynthesis